MKDTKSTISQGQSYQEIGKFWDTHDLTDFWSQTEPVEFEVAIDSEIIYYPVETSLSDKLAQVARQRGVSAETLLNLWVQERLAAVTG